MHACFENYSECFFSIIVCELAIFNGSAFDAFYCAFIRSDSVASAYEAECIEQSIFSFCKRKVDIRIEETDDSTPHDVSVVESRAAVTSSFNVSAASNPC